MLLPRSARRCVNYVNNLLVDDLEFNSDGSDVLFITFAGMAGILKTFARIRQKLGIETRPFEFVHSLQDKNCDVLFLRDRHRAYYHFGVKGVGGSVDEVAAFLNRKIAERQYKLVVTLGHSMGGYASLLFASKVKSDICISISPRTFLDPENRAIHSDNRFKEEIARLYKSQGNATSEFCDLKRYFVSSDNRPYANSCTYFLFFGGGDRLDRVHATRMLGLNRPFHIYEVENAGHNAARHMRESGSLLRLVDNILRFNDHRNLEELVQSISSEPTMQKLLMRSRSLA
jgi:hypothetical protein